MVRLVRYMLEGPQRSDEVSGQCSDGRRHQILGAAHVASESAPANLLTSMCAADQSRHLALPFASLCRRLCGWQKSEPWNGFANHCSTSKLLADHIKTWDQMGYAAMTKNKNWRYGRPFFLLIAALSLEVGAARHMPQEPAWKADFSDNSCYLWASKTGGLDLPYRVANINFLRFQQGASGTEIARKLQQAKVRPGELVFLASVSSDHDADDRLKISAGNMPATFLTATEQLHWAYIRAPGSERLLSQLRNDGSVDLELAMAAGPLERLSFGSGGQTAFDIRQAQFDACWNVLSAP